MSRFGRGGFNPENQPGIAETGEIKKRNLFLHKLKEAARVMVMAGVASGLGAGTVAGQGAERRQAASRGFDFTKWYQSQYERVHKLEEKERELQKLFGNNYSESASYYREGIEEETKRYKESSYSKYFIPVDLFGIRPFNSETRETKKTETAPLYCKDGVLESMDLSEIIDQTFPKGWVNNEVEAVITEKEIPKRNVGNSGPKEGWITIAVTRPSKEGRDKIIFSETAVRNESTNYIVNTFGHEIAHANSWMSDNETGDEEKADLLLKIADRLSSADRYKSSYVESINNQDKNKEKYTKASEYWAEICAQYFEDPTQLNVKDFQIVDAQVRKTDPNYDWQKSRSERARILSKVSRTK